ncbi:hypothetical protein [Tenacibaculum ovolyticum]|uniref:hypothetical protein n=1 Tax=Tenacibaculum ovolyticum TaxID=104270 RepID=UPI00041C4773|nr:hypothetical protein [Tenacibaculum ovolyticum]
MTKIKILLLFFISLISVNCKKVKTDNLAYNINTENKLNLNGTWYCNDFTKENRINTKYSIGFAKENVKYSKFQIKNDSIFFGNCSKKIYKYSYSLEKKKYDEESVFVTHFKLQKKAIDFFTIDDEESCVPIESPIFYIKSNKEVVILDRGYFFSYKNEKKNKPHYSVIGIPSNNREYWEVNGVYKNSSINIAYNNFLSEFEYGGENLLKASPDKSFIDEKNSIEYLVENNRLIVEKSDPMGTIYINFKRNGDRINFTYKLEYPEY